jgi:hypothetical protein
MLKSCSNIPRGTQPSFHSINTIETDLCQKLETQSELTEERPVEICGNAPVKRGGAENSTHSSVKAKELKQNPSRVMDNWKTQTHQ